MKRDDEVNILKLTEILKLSDIAKTKIRLNPIFENNLNPIKLFQKNRMETLLMGMYWNYSKQKSYKEG